MRVKCLAQEHNTMLEPGLQGSLQKHGTNIVIFTILLIKALFDLHMVETVRNMKAVQGSDPMH